MSYTLYQMVGDYKRIEEDLDGFIEAIEAGEMDEDVLWDTLDSINESIGDKCDHIVQILRNKELLSASLDSEIKRLQARKKAVDKGVDRLKSYMSESLSILGIDNLETPHAKFSFRSSKACKLTDAQIALNWALANGRAELLKIPEPEPSTSAIKEALLNGEEIPGAILVRNRNLQIK